MELLTPGFLSAFYLTLQFLVIVSLVVAVSAYFIRGECDQINLRCRVNDRGYWHDHTIHRSSLPG